MSKTKSPKDTAILFDAITKAIVSGNPKPNVKSKRKKGELYYLSYNMRILSPEQEDIERIIKCWVVAPSQAQAEKRVIQEIKSLNWKILDLITVKIVSAKNYNSNNPDREHFDFAIGSGFRCNVKQKKRV
jgi:hypothetical protein